MNASQLFSSGPISDVPIASGLASTAVTISSVQRFAGVEQQQTTSTSFVDAVNYTGAGVLSFVAEYASTGAIVYCDVIVDGVTIYSGSTAATTNSTICPVGAIGYNGTTPAGVAFEAIPFKTSLRIQHKAAAGTATCLYKYRKTQ